MKQIIRRIAIGILVCLAVVAVYVLTVTFPQPFYPYHLTIGDITVYSDKPIPTNEITVIVGKVMENVKKSVLYKTRIQQNFFITNNPVRWLYFTLWYHNVGGLNYVCFNHTVFLRHSDIQKNILFGPSGKPSGGDRTLDYYMAHEMTHTLEFLSMAWYRYPLTTNWTLEGYAEYIAHGSPSYEVTLDRYYHGNETAGAKNYTKMRLAVTYLLEKEHLKISELWRMVDRYNEVMKKTVGE